MLSSEQNPEQCHSLPHGKLATKVDSSTAAGNKKNHLYYSCNSWL
jgi:hypothetical protein